MKKNRLALSDAAAADIVEQAEWYSAQSGSALAARWECAVTSAILSVVSRLTTGAPCAFQIAGTPQYETNGDLGIPQASALLQV